MSSIHATSSWLSGVAAVHVARFLPQKTFALCTVAALLLLAPDRVSAQVVSPRSSPATTLSLAAAQAAARQSSAALRAAREAALAARARERQANAWLNPTIAYGREATAGGGQSNAQDIAQLEQPLEWRGLRDARRDAARLRGDVADSRVQSEEQALAYDVARAYASVLSATHRAAVADDAAAAFEEAGRVSAQRLAAGDVSGYAARRLQLEIARQAAQRAAAQLVLRAARIELSSLLGTSPDSLSALVGTAREATRLPSLDSLHALAARMRPDIRALSLEAAATAADARVALAERVPTPTLSAGYKRESNDGGGGNGRIGLNGFVVGFAMPLPVFDRRRFSIDAAAADTRLREAEVDTLRRRVRLEVDEAYGALHAVDTQLELLRPHLGESARVAMRAVQAAYAEGEISLLEWLDAQRTYQEAESTFATLDADVITRRAALERAVGISLFTSIAR